MVSEHCRQEDKSLAFEGESRVCLLGWGQSVCGKENEDWAGARD